MSFDRAVEWLIAVEGGYVNDPNDPGGETKYGISRRSYPHLDIKNLTKADAEKVYKTDFWDRVRADEMPYNLALPVFDMAVNAGPTLAIKCLQRALSVADDGKLGPITLAKAQHAPKNAPRYFAQHRLMVYSEMKGWVHYKKHWILRTLKCLLEAP